VLKLLRIEFRKQIYSSGFWILLALHAVVLVLIAVNFNSFLKNANIISENVPNMELALKPILQFPDVWQNLTYIAGYFKIILALIVISSVCNEFSYGTARQNIVDGMTRRDWIFSKIGLAKVLALFSTLLVLTIGLILGFSHDTDIELSFVFLRMNYILAYFIELLVYFIYAVFLALLIKRTGMSVILLLAYDFILEPILSWSVPNPISNFLPMSTIDNLNTFPFTKYLGNPTEAIVSAEQLFYAAAYGIAFSLFSYLLLKKKDL
jgi:ABC-2 type transport system permease protein